MVLKGGEENGHGCSAFIILPLLLSEIDEPKGNWRDEGS